MDYAAALDRVVRMTRMASAGNVVGVRAVVEDIDNGLPGYWQTTAGRLYLRLATIGAINHHKLGVVRYLCGARGVPALGDYKEDELALAESMRCYSFDGNPYFLPLQAAITHCRTDIGMYLLTLIGPTENLGRSLDAGTNLLHHTARSGELFLSKALVRRGVDFDQRNDAGMTPLECAIRWSCMPVVRFLLEQYRARGRDPQEMLRGLVHPPPLSENGTPHHLIFSIIRARHIVTISNEDKRAMVKLLVQEAGADIWAEARMVNHNGVGPLHLPLHAAAFEANQPVLDFFLTECAMPVDTPDPEWRLTSLHILATLKRIEADVFPIVTWLVEEKAADVTVLDEKGVPAAELALQTGKMRVYDYLRKQEKRQAARKAEEEKRQAARKAKEKKKQDEEKASLFKAIVAKAAREEKK